MGKSADIGIDYYAFFCLIKVYCSAYLPICGAALYKGIGIRFVLGDDTLSLP